MEDQEQNKEQNQEQDKEQNKDKEQDGNPIVDKSFQFAVKAIKLSRWLKERFKDYELISQMLRSATSIGANVAEAQSAQSRPDFISKMHIALKETYETIYWLKLFEAVGMLSKNNAKQLLDDAQELKKMLSSIVKTSKEAQKRINEKN